MTRVLLLGMLISVFVLVGCDQQTEVAQEQIETTPPPVPTPTPLPTPTPEPVAQEEPENASPKEDPMERFDIVAFAEIVNVDNPVWAELLPLLEAPEFKIFYDRVTFLGDSIMKGAVTNASIKDLDVIFAERMSILTENANVEAEVA